jgi:predicted RNA-binding protein with PIN domain
MREYMTEVHAYTRGRGRLTSSLKGYAPCHNAQEIIEAVGYDPESDVENTPDSVFCSHGAGVIVKWDQVPEHMHMDRVYKEAPKEEPEIQVNTRPTPPVPKHHSAYGSWEEDQELEAIFQRTFGSRGQRLIPSYHRSGQRGGSSEAAREAAAAYRAAHARPAGEQKDYLLVDGYNIIFAWEELKSLAKDNLDAARLKLMDILCNYQGFTRCELICVFDAYKVKGGAGEVGMYHNIHVVYTKEAQTADAYIEKTSKDLAKKHRVRVATSDGLEQIIVLGHGAIRVSARELHEEMERIAQELEQYLS